MDNPFIGTNEITNYLSETIDNLDKIIQYLQTIQTTREQDIAIQKLEEAVFWLTYGIDEVEK